MLERYVLPNDRAFDFLRRRGTRTRCPQAAGRITPNNRQNTIGRSSNKRSTDQLYLANAVAPIPCRRRAESD